MKKGVEERKNLPIASSAPHANGATPNSLSPWPIINRLDRYAPNLPFGCLQSFRKVQPLEKKSLAIIGKKKRPYHIEQECLSHPSLVALGHLRVEVEISSKLKVPDVLIRVSTPL